MKIVYNKLMHDEISSSGYKPILLLHSCCAPCSSAVIEKLKEYFDITYLYFNPNIFPKDEYDRRKEQFKKLGVEVIDLGYDHDEFLAQVKGLENEREGGMRCNVCIANRMDKAFEYAKSHNFDYVTTTLTISPHKNAEFINLTGENLEKKYQIKYLYADFKKENGFLRSTQLAKQLDIYRQNYCGCEFSAKQDF